MSLQIRALESLNSHVADGTQTIWDFSFVGGYLNSTHVKAFYVATDGTVVTLTPVLSGPSQVTITPAVPNGYELTIYRKTPTDAPMVNFTDKAQLTEASLDLIANQAVLAAAEAKDWAQLLSDFNNSLIARQQATNAAASAAAAAATAATINDANLVHKTGIESIGGAKTFTAAAAFNAAASFTGGITATTATFSNNVTFSAAATFNGTVVGLTKSTVGLANVDNTSDANKPVSTATQTALNAKLDATALVGRTGVTGLLGASPGNTTFSFACDTVVLRNASGTVVARAGISGTTLSGDVSVAGPAANGRDQAAAFTANSWVHVYIIWNGTTLATVTSTVGPTGAGPAMPAGYTHWCYATSLRWGTALQAAYLRGAEVWLQNYVSILSSGAATTLTQVVLTSVAPPNATCVHAYTNGGFTHTSAGVANQLVMQYTSTDGLFFDQLITTQLANTQMSYGLHIRIPYTTGGLWYYWTTAIGTRACSINVLGYRICNGDS